MAEHYTPKQYLFKHLWPMIEYLERDYHVPSHPGDLSFALERYWTAMASFENNGDLSPQEAEELVKAYDDGLRNSRMSFRDAVIDDTSSTVLTDEENEEYTEDGSESHS